MFDHRRSRAATVQVLELAEGGVIDWESVARDALNWMSEAEVAEFARANGYLEEQE
jgi:hypothetical protein